MSFRFCPVGACWLILSFWTGVLVPVQAQSGKQVLDHADFLTWKTIQQPEVGARGDFVAYRLVPGEGDGDFCINALNYNATTCLPRVSLGELDYGGLFAYGLITPHRDSLRALERRKVDKKKWPADTLFIRNLNLGTMEKIAQVKSYQAPERLGDWLAYELKQEALQGDTIMAKRKADKDLFHLVIRRLSTGQSDTILFVKEYTWADEAPILAVITGQVDSTVSAGAWIWNAGNLRALRRSKGEFTKPAISDDGRQVAFLSHSDTTKALVKPWHLYYSGAAQDSSQALAGPDESDLPQVSPNMPPSFSGNGRFLFYGRAEKSLIRDTSLLKDEWVDVEVWSTRDPVLYTVQNKKKAADEKKAYAASYNTITGKYVQIATPASESVTYSEKRNGRFALTYTEKPYTLLATWNGEVPKDLEAVDLESGRRTVLRRNILTSPRLSPGGDYAYGYSDRDSTWWTCLIPTNNFRLLDRVGTDGFHDELNDVPSYPNGYGAAGWVEGDKEFILYDRYDLWRWIPGQGTRAEKLTTGRADHNVFRYIRLDPEKESIPANAPWLLHAFNEDDKSAGYAWYDITRKRMDPLKLEPYQFSRRVLKARLSEILVFEKENFQVFPDLQLSRDRLRTSSRITDANPQQKNYAWGTIELYHWIDWDSIPRTGLLVKPAGYNKLRSYPTIVNFYERSSDGLHDHRTPAPHRSTINYAFYASRGYVIFNPDVSYVTGAPGESAYKIVMSGVTSLFKDRIADPEHIGLQGHSWGGYQVAYITSRTPIFTCAEAGAPVVNMTSAYGGIRWESGMSRMFQYEKQQSRLGKTLWEEPRLYLDNSPLFKLDKVETPLLILHNDEDGAVPWEQGIEYYMALRRLGKTAWLLNYRGEPHWPLQWHLRKDFQLRMSQFFDHYLMDKPMPDWMANGIPAVERGIRTGTDAEEDR